MNIIRSIGILFLLSLTLGTTAQSQNISDLLTDFGITEIARNYLQPAADAVGYSFNSGLYHTAEVEQGFNLWVGVRGVWTFVPEDEKNFTAVLPEEMVALGYPSQVTTATVLGDKGALLQSSMQDAPDVQLPGGINTNSTYIFMPHAVVGSFAGFNLMVRGVPPVEFDSDVGKVSFIGAGLKFSPTYFTQHNESARQRFDVALMVAAQRFEAGDYLTVVNYNANVHASVNFGLLTLFSGVGFERYNIDVAYTYDPPDDLAPDAPPSLLTPKSIELGFNRDNFRYTVGADLTLITLVNISADYSFGVQDNFSFGVGVKL